jgi:phosphopantetheinyl transferase (holo-ACP synthase)
MTDLSAISEENKVLNAEALTWTTRLTLPHALAWVQRATTLDAHAVWLAVSDLPAFKGCPPHCAADLVIARDALGKPYVTWHGELADRAMQVGLDSRHCHITNTHDGGAHLVLAAYHERLAGLGIDLVALQRLRGPGKEADYLRRFARHFMSVEEWHAFKAASIHDSEEALRLRIAAHFSLMEAASKALGTGLKIGAGMGHADSLRKQALGVNTLSPEVEMLLDPTARERMRAIEAHRVEAHWAANDAFLVSVVLAWKDMTPGRQTIHQQTSM